MDPQTKAAAVESYRAMRRKIQEIEKSVLELRSLGQRLPMVDKNTRCILSFTRVLRYAISDPADVLDQKEV